MACKGNNTEPCGGPSRLSLFYSKNPVGPQPNPGVNDFQLIGCYRCVILPITADTHSSPSASLDMLIQELVRAQLVVH